MASWFLTSESISIVFIPAQNRVEAFPAESSRSEFLRLGRIAYRFRKRMDECPSRGQGKPWIWISAASGCNALAKDSPAPWYPINVVIFCMAISWACTGHVLLNSNVEIDQPRFWTAFTIALWLRICLDFALFSTPIRGGCVRKLFEAIEMLCLSLQRSKLLVISRDWLKRLHSSLGTNVAVFGNHRFSIHSFSSEIARRGRCWQLDRPHLNWYGRYVSVIIISKYFPCKTASN